jgi:hypothetical protein
MMGDVDTAEMVVGLEVVDISSVNGSIIVTLAVGYISRD